MELSKSYLETVSTTELLKLADIYGLYIPKGLDREFIIGEFLEFADEDRFLPKSSMIEVDDLPSSTKVNLDKYFQNTEIHVLIRDPMWVFVFWNFHTDLLNATIESPNFQNFFLRVVIMEKDDTTESPNFFDVDVDVSDRNRYLYLSFDYEICRVALCFRTDSGTIQILAQSNIIDLPRRNIQKQLCISQNTASDVLKLSGLKIIKSTHFNNFRQAFRSEND